MNNTLKPISHADADQTLKHAFNDVDASYSNSGFLVGIVGRQIAQVISTTTTTNDTLTFNYSENGTALYSIQLIFTDATYTTMLTATRIA
jgi:hypothetical protein